MVVAPDACHGHLYAPMPSSIAATIFCVTAPYTLNLDFEGTVSDMILSCA
jgi:hypothetical protein